MRLVIALALLTLAGPAVADELSGDDTGYGRPTPSNPCDCAPGDDGVDWNGDGLSNSDDAAYAPPGAYKNGTAYGTGTPGSYRPFGTKGESGGSTGRGQSYDAGHGSSDGGRGPK